MKLLISHRIVLLVVRIIWSAFVVLISVVLSFELLKASHRFHRWLLVSDSVVVIVLPSRRTISFPSRLIVAVSLVVSPGTSQSDLLLDLKDLLFLGLIKPAD